MGFRVGAELDVVSVEKLLTGWPLLWRCLPPRLGWMLEGNYYPQRSWFEYGKLGFRPRAVVAAGTRVVTVCEHSNVLLMPICGPDGRVILE